MRRQADAGWVSGETFNLMEVFQNQISRINTEWGDYLDAMHREYISEKAKLEGVDPAIALAEAEAARRAAELERKRKKKGAWLSKEKQEQLIHTAPVLSPSSQSVRSGLSTGSASPGRPHGGSPAPLSAAARRQLQDLNQRYKAARSEVELQRDDAIRWVLRQRNRMVMQADAVEAERGVQVAHMQRYSKLLSMLSSRLNRLKHVAESLAANPTGVRPSSGTAAASPSWQAKSRLVQRSGSDRATGRHSSAKSRPRHALLSPDIEPVSVV